MNRDDSNGFVATMYAILHCMLHSSAGTSCVHRTNDTQHNEAMGDHVDTATFNVFFCATQIKMKDKIIDELFLGYPETRSPSSIGDNAEWTRVPFKHYKSFAPVHADVCRVHDAAENGSQCVSFKWCASDVWAVTIENETIIYVKRKLLITFLREKLFTFAARCFDAIAFHVFRPPAVCSLDTLMWELWRVGYTAMTVYFDWRNGSHGMAQLYCRYRDGGFIVRTDVAEHAHNGAVAGGGRRTNKIE